MKVSFYQISLKPIVNSVLACSGGRLVTPADSDSEAKCKIITLLNDSDTFYFVFIDCLYIGKDLEAKIVKILDKLPGKLLLVSATHSHSLPNLSNNHSYFGSVNNEYLNSLLIGLTRFVENYSLLKVETVLSIHVERLSSRNVTLRRRALRRPFFDVSRVLAGDQKIKKKLRLIFGGIVMFPSKQKISDCIGISMSVKTSNRSITFMSVFTHPTNIKNGCSRDIYSLYEKKCLENGREFVGVHGFGADLKLYMVKRAGFNIKRSIRNLLLGPSYPVLSEEDLSKIVQESSSGTIERLDNMDNCDYLEIRTCDIAGEIGVRDDRLPLEYAFKVIYIGSLVVVSANCEVSSLYYDELSLHISNDRFLFPISCTGECVGYMPHYNQVGQGGYEDSKFIQYFGLSGQVDKRKLIALVDRLKMVLKDKG